MSTMLILISLLLTQLAVGHDLTKSDLPVDTTSFCRAMFIDMAEKQLITAQPDAMLTNFSSTSPKTIGGNLAGGLDTAFIELSISTLQL